MSSDSVKDISFKESFRRARDAGLKTFPFNGKQYTTELLPLSQPPKLKLRPPKRQSLKLKALKPTHRFLVRAGISRIPTRLH